jgi:hypothetical protein
LAFTATARKKKSSKMAAMIFMKRKSGKRNVTSRQGENVSHDNTDRNDHVQPSRKLTLAGFFVNDKESNGGKVPKGDEVLMKGIMQKYSSSYLLKTTEVYLTAEALCMSRPGEELIRDLIPIDQILDVKKTSKYHEFEGNQASMNHLRRVGSMRTLRISSLVDEDTMDNEKHVIQIRTEEGGYNSGRTFFLRTPTDAECQTWIQAIRSAVQSAKKMKRGGAATLSNVQFMMWKAYNSVYSQSLAALLIFASFLVNILQTELTSSRGDPALPFDALELFFTIAFTVELVINMLAHFFTPFFKVSLTFSHSHILH